MSRLKKWFCILMVCALIVNMMPASAAAEIASGTCGNNLTWSLDEDGVLKINGTGEMTDYDAPDSPSGASVAPWFGEHSRIKEVIVGSGVTTIGNRAFLNCENLINVELPEGITRIGIGIFSGSNNLKAVTLPKSLREIGPDCFNYSGLKKIYYADSKEQWNTIDGGGDVEDDHIPTGDNEDDYATIYYESIGGQCGDNAYWSFVETTGTLTIDGTGDMWDYPSLNASPWYGIDALASAKVGSGITSIGHGAFEGCSGLTSITVPDGITSIGNSAFNGCSGLTGITIPDGVTSIEGNAFWGCSNLTGITIPDGVTSIAGFTFYGCSSLTNITIPNSVTSIEHSAFYGCSGLTSITIPDGVTSIEDYAFYDCSRLTSITIPNDVTSIGDSVFSGCISLASIEIPDSITSIGNYAFSNCSDLTTNIEIPNVTSIGDGAFYGCSSLTRIEISNNVTSIGKNAFHFCNGLMSIEIPNSVTSIAEFTFYDCSSLTSITIPNSVTSIGDSAFSGCSGLTSITIPDSITSIGASAFNGCSSLMSIEIPDGVTSIGNRAFEGCEELEDVYYSGSRSDWLKIGEESGNSDIGDGVLKTSETKSAVVHYGEEKAPFVIELDIANPMVYIAPTANATVDYALARYETNSLDSRLSDKLRDHMNSSMDPNNIPANMTVLQSMNEDVKSGGVSIGSMFDIYGDPSFKDWAASYIGSLQAGSSSNIVGSARNVNIDISKTQRLPVDCSKWELSPGVEYIFLTSGRVQGDPTSTPAFRAIYPVHIGDDQPPVVQSISPAFIPDDMIGEQINVEIRFDDALYYYDTTQSPATARGIDLGPLERSGSQTDFVSILSMAQSLPNTLKLYTDASHIGQNTNLISVEVNNLPPVSTSFTFYPNICDQYKNIRRSPSLSIDFARGQNAEGLWGYRVVIPREWDGTTDKRYSKDSSDYTVSFLGGVGASGAAPKPDKVAEGVQFRLPTNPFRKTGASFGGWLCDVDGMTYQEGSTYTMPAQDVTFTATWLDIPYTVTFTGGTGAEGTAPVQEATIQGGQFNLPENPFTRTDHTFSGWLCDSDRQRYQPGAAFTMPARNVTFTAEWTYAGTVYTLPDAYNGCSYITDLLDVLGPDTGDVVFQASGLPRWLHMTEEGLLSGTPGSTGKVSFTVTVSARQVSGEGNWAIGYAEGRAAEGTFHFRLTVRESSLTVSFDSGGGIGTMEPVNVRYADDYTLPSSTFTASEEGSAFGGWFYDGKLYPAGSVLRVIGDINLKAYWHPAPSVTLELSELSSAVLHVPYNVKLAEIACKDFSFDEVVFLYVDGLPGWLSIEDGKLFGLPPKTGREEFSVIATVREGEKIYTAAIKISLTIKMNSKENVNNEIDEGYKVIKPVPDMKEAIASQVFISEGAYARFVSVYLNGRELIRGMEYTAREGSTVITISEQTLKTVGTGTHTIAATFKSTDSMNTLRRSAQNFTIGTLQTSSPSGGNSGGGGGGGSASSAVSIPSFANGSVKCKSTKAIKGTVVALMVSPDSGFILSSLTVLDSSGKEVTLTRKNTNEYTFIMPASAVSVSASFVPAQSAVIPENTGIQFNDVSPESWYYEPVKWALENGITKGVKKNEFAPDQGCTRAQLITFLWNAAGMPEPEGEGKEFWDVAQDTYYAKAVQWASAQGITNGVGGRAFAPDRTISRGDAVNMLYSMAGKPKVDTENTFRDVDMRYETAVLWASNNGVTSYKKRFSPSSNCTRAQIVTFLYRMRDK